MARQRKPKSVSQVTAAPPVSTPVPVAAHRRWIVLLMMGIGLALAVLTSWEFAQAHGWADDPRSNWIGAIAKDWAVSLLAIAIGFGLAMIGLVQRAVIATTEYLRAPSPAFRRRMAFGLAVGATLYFAVTATIHQRAMFPTVHDEQMYLLQARMLASGKLWMAPHPIGQFFETFYVLSTPVYAATYFPGTALMHAPAAAIGWPTWIMPVLLAGASVGLLYLVVTELIDGAAGLLAALLLPSLSMFRWASMAVMSHSAGLILALALVYLWLVWRKSPRIWLVAIMGAIAGWYAITRPLDAVCVVGPIAVAMLITLWRQRRSAIPASIAVAILAGAPFIALQLVFDHGVTGHWLQTPVGLYNSTHSPQVSMGFREVDPSFRPATHLLQKRMLYQYFILPLQRQLREQGIVRQMIESRLPMVCGVTLPSAALLILLPVGFLGWRDRRNWVIWAALLGYLVAMMGFFAMLRQYCLFAIPGVAITVLLGMRAVQATWPGSRLLAAGLPLAVLALAVVMLPEVAGTTRAANRFEWPVMMANYEIIPASVQTPAIVLFRYHPSSHFDEEPVYNLDAAWPDDAPIIRAHDLGPAEDLKLLNYYAQRQPERTVYLFDRQTMELHPLGNVKALAEGMNAAAKAASTRPGK